MVHITESRRNFYIAASCAYLAALALALHRALPWLGWGVQPEFAVSAYTASSGVSSASPLFIILGGLTGRLIGPGGFEFSLNIFAAVLFAVLSAAVFFAAKRLGRSIIPAISAWAIFAAAAARSGVFDSAGPAPYIVALTVVCIWAIAALYSGEDAPPLLPAAALIFGIAAAQHLFLVTLLAFSIAYVIFRLGDRKFGSHIIAASAFSLAAGASHIIFLMLRPQISLSQGASWPAGFFDAANIPLASKLLETYSNVPPIGPYAWSLFNLIDSPLAPCFPALALALVGFALVRGKKRDVSLFLLSFILLPVCMYSITPSRSIPLFSFLAICSLAFLFASSSGEILSSAAGSESSFVSGLTPALAAVIIAAGCLPAFSFRHEAFTAPKSGSRQYSEIFLKNLRRDPLVFVETPDEPLYVLSAQSGLRRIRPDAVLIYPDSFSSKSYRKYLRNGFGGLIKMPTEKEYSTMRAGTVQISQKFEEAAVKESIQKQRIEYNVLMIAQQTTAVENSKALPVYFNTAQRFMKSRNFNSMSFDPAVLSVKYRPVDLESCIGDFLWSFADSGRITNFTQDREGAAKQIDTAKKSLASFAMSCDAAPQGYSEKCLKANLIMTRMKAARPQSKKTMEEALKKDYSPMPQITTLCFVRKYYFDPLAVADGWKRIKNSEILSDPKAAELASNYYADLGEHAYLHNDPGNVEWFFKIASGISRGNARAHLFLMLLYENSAMHNLASKEADTLYEVLSAKESAGELDEYYYFMLQELFTKLGRPGDAEKYRKLITGESGNNLLP